MKHVLIAVTSCGRQGNSGRFTGYDLAGVSHSYLMFRDQGYEVDFVSPQGSNPPIEKYQLSDPISRAFLEDDDAQFRIRNSRRPEALQAGDYRAIFCAGGQGALWDFPQDQALQQLVAEIYRHGGVIGAHCQGLAGLLDVRLGKESWLLAGKRVHSRPEPEPFVLPWSEPFDLDTRLLERDAILRRTPSLGSQFVISGRLVTSQHSDAAEAVARAMVDILGRTQIRPGYQGMLKAG